jgi:hypothetical protein
LTGPPATAIVRGISGKGLVACASPHPELTKGIEEAVRRLVRLTAGERGAR